MIITTAIIDDEPLAAQLLEGYAKKVPYLQLKGVYNSAVESMRELRNNPVQLLFLDIQMPELSGIEFAKILPPTTKIVFTTAFQQYAVEGYQVRALDYLLKPVSFEGFLKAANRAQEHFTLQARQQNMEQDRFLFVKSDYKLISVPFDQILYIEGLKDYVRFYLKDGQRIMSLMNMKKLEDYLPKPEFLRVHRSYIVHMPMVPSVERARLVFGEQFIPVSDSYKDAVQQYIDQHTLA